MEVDDSELYDRTPPPLYGAPWERAAIKEVTEIAYLLGMGVFDNVGGLVDRMRTSADAIEQMYSRDMPSQAHCNAFLCDWHYWASED